jgi:hypothetical protein
MKAQLANLVPEFCFYHETHEGHEKRTGEEVKKEEPFHTLS